MSEAPGAPGRRPNQGRVGSVVNGKWHIDARIGSGGMATVYAATHRNGHRAALKMLHMQLSRDESNRARFLREGYVANAVGHPAVVRVDDDGVSEDGAAFLVLELLEGETVEARRRRLGGVMPVDEVLDIADAALDALAAAHEKGIVHRDVKPDNVFVTWDNQVKLLDFGLARMKHMQAEITKTGVTIGTPEFMPPEQAQRRRDEVDALSDVWAVGATVFTSITGEYVHGETASLHEQLIASATKRARSIRSLSPHVPVAIAIVIDRALELEKADRWESAREMQRALRAARAPRSDSEADVASLRRDAAPIAIPEGPRPSGVGLPSSSSGPTLQYHGPPSDPTLEELAPVTVHLEDLPTSSADTHDSTQQMMGAPRQPVAGRHDSTLPSAAPIVPPGFAMHPHPHSPSFTTTSNTGPHRPILSSSGGAHQATLSSSGGYASLEPQTGVGQAHMRGAGPPSPPHLTSGPVSLPGRRSSSRVVIASVILILLSAAMGAWMLLH